MHILFLCSAFPYPENSTYKHTIMQTVRALYRKGAEVTILAQVSINEAIDIEKIPDEVKKLANYYIIEVEQKLTFLDKFTNFIFSTTSIEEVSYRSLGFVDELQKIIEKTPPDVIQFEGINMAVYRGDVPTDRCVLRIHDYEAPKYNALIAGTNDIVKKNYYQACQKRLEDWEWTQVLSGKFSRVMLYDNAFKAEIAARFVPEKHIPPNIYIPIYGFDFTKMNCQEAQTIEPNSVYWIGSLDILANQKALTWFISNVWSSVFANYPHAKLYIAARNRPESFLVSISTTQGVHWLGNIENIYDFMASKQIMVLPMRGYEGQQMRLLEGMGAGNAIVASTQALQGIQPRHRDHLFVAKDANHFIQLLSTLIEHPNIGLAMGNHAKVWVREKLSQEAMDSRLLGFYQTC